MKQPEYVNLVGSTTIEAAGDEKQLPRFQMVAYTGGPMRITGFSHPVVVDLAQLARIAAQPVLGGMPWVR